MDISDSSDEENSDDHPPIANDHPALLPVYRSPHPRTSHGPPDPIQPDPFPHWSRTNAKRARFSTFCPACKLQIPTGDRIVYQFQYRRFVHELCAAVPTDAPHYEPSCHPDPPQASAFSGDPLAPGSPLDELSPSYRSEAVRWVQYHGHLHRIPGIQTEFSTTGAEAYLAHRSRTCKSLHTIESKLKKMGEKCGFVLCNTKHQQPSLQYQRLRSKKAELLAARRNKGLDGDTNAALGTGKVAITMLLSGFDVRSAKRMQGWHPLHLELLVIHAMTHAGCLRFGLFRDTDILREDLVWHAQDDCHALLTTWRKRGKSNRPYSIRFPHRPAKDSPARYELPGERGPTIVSAGKLLTWYLRVTNLTKAPGHALLFPTLAQVGDRRAVFAKWLRFAYGAILPPNSAIPQRIRPHSGRAGWATDRSRQNAPEHTLAAEGRWKDPRAMRLYIRTCLRDLCTSANHRMIPAAFKAAWPPRT